MYGHRLPEKHPLRRKSVITDFEPSEVDIERAHECEIKNIVERHIKTRQPLPTGQNDYVDATTIPNDLQTRLQSVHSGLMAWESLPNAVKREYRTPQEFLAALESPSQEQILTQLGFHKINKAPESSDSKPQGAPPAAGDASPSGT